MSYAPLGCASALIAVGVALTHAPSAAAEPNIDTQSAAAVIKELQDEGYAVEINGVSRNDGALFVTCKVTQIRHTADLPGDSAPPTTVYLDVACPISHG